LIEDNKGVIRNRYSKEQTIQWPKEEGTDNTMAKKRRNRQYNGQKKKEQTIQWPKKEGQNDKRQTIVHNTLNRKMKDD
jgi:hypothetical protein